MKKWMCWMLVLTLIGQAFGAAAAYESREALRGAFRALGDSPDESPYLHSPAVAAPHAAGSLTETALEDVLAYVNFLRSIAGVAPVGRSRIYDMQCQHGATLLAAVDYADHYAEKPADMAQDFYDSAYRATSSSNVAKFNWMRPSILREAMAYFVRDDGAGNLAVLGHRRWLLNPHMAETGFGLANSESGMSYVVMYAHDLGCADAQWSEVCWPAGGAFPVELMHADLAWSVMLNPEIYDVAGSEVRVELAEESMGLRFRFDCTAQTGDGFCTINTGSYGGGPCVIFRPDFHGLEFADYVQNQRWSVRVTGLKLHSGESAELNYTVDMASLYVQEVANIELSQLEAALAPGEILQLSAAVIPGYADDLCVNWSSSDEAVARVSDDGRVEAIAPGTCTITAASANGRQDCCVLTVGG